MSKKVSLARVDQRLLHATVTLNWDPFLKVDYVAVVGSEYRNDPFTESVLQLCLPNFMKVKILQAEELMDFIEKEDGHKPSKVMIIFKDLKTADHCIRLGLELDEIQMPYPTVAVGGKKSLSSYFSEEEIQWIKNIQSHGTKLYFQTLPYQAKDYMSFGN